MKKKKSKKVSLEKEKSYSTIPPSEDFIAREGYFRRRTHWMWRLRPYLLKKYEKCKVCLFGQRCHRVPLNERVTAKIAAGKECPDFKSVWKTILSDEKPYDWGF